VVFLFKYKLSICFYYDLFLKVPYYRAILKLLYGAPDTIRTCDRWYRK